MPSLSRPRRRLKPSAESPHHYRGDPFYNTKHAIIVHRQINLYEYFMGLFASCLRTTEYRGPEGLMQSAENPRGLWHILWGLRSEEFSSKEKRKMWCLNGASWSIPARCSNNNSWNFHEMGRVMNLDILHQLGRKIVCISSCVWEYECEYSHAWYCGLRECREGV